MKQTECDDVCMEDGIEDNAFDDSFVNKDEYEEEDECPCDKIEDPICEEKEEECDVKVEVPWSDKVRTRIRSIDKLKEKDPMEDWGYMEHNHKILKLEESNLNGRTYPEKEVLAMIGKWYSKGALPVAIRQSLCEDSLGGTHNDTPEDLSKLEQIGTAFDFKVTEDHWLTCTIKLTKPGKFPYYTLSCLGQASYQGLEIADTPITSVSDLELVCICNSSTTSNVEDCANQYHKICKELWDARMEIKSLNRKIKAQKVMEDHYRREMKRLNRKIEVAETLRARKERLDNM